MDLNGPRRPGPYDERLGDCIEALRPVFVDYLRDTGSRFVDVVRIMAALTPDAVSVGWTYDDIQEAILLLAEEMQTRNRNLNQIDPAVEHPNSYLTKH
jgi:hypothetical protein